MKIESLYRYPVKGLTPEPLAEATLTPGRCLPWDRAFALAQGDSAFDPQNPGWVWKANSCACCATPASRGSPRNSTTPPACSPSPRQRVKRCKPRRLRPRRPGQLNQILHRLSGRGRPLRRSQTPPAFHHFEDHSFCDHKTQVVSLIGLGSLRALESAAGAPRDKRRFRANIYIENIEPWAEFDWLGKTLAIGDVTMLVEERIDRCGATCVTRTPPCATPTP